MCDGQLLPISQYSALFSLLGTIYGGDGRTTFALPDLRGRVPIHQGNGPGLPSYREGQKGGQATTTLSVANLPSHSHTGVVRATTKEGDQRLPEGNLIAVPNDGENNFASTTGAELKNTASDLVISNAGGGQSFDNMQPFLAVNYIIALQGIYPSRN